MNCDGKTPPNSKIDNLIFLCNLTDIIYKNKQGSKRSVEITPKVFSTKFSPKYPYIQLIEVSLALKHRTKVLKFLAISMVSNKPCFLQKPANETILACSNLSLRYNVCYHFIICQISDSSFLYHVFKNLTKAYTKRSIVTAITSALIYQAHRVC